jgi:hypothetical protein
MGWGGITNGKLLALAQEEFDVFVTVDQVYAEISQQQANRPGRSIPTGKMSSMKEVATSPHSVCV